MLVLHMRSDEEGVDEDEYEGVRQDSLIDWFVVIFFWLCAALKGLDSDS